MDKVKTSFGCRHETFVIPIIDPKTLFMSEFTSPTVNSESVIDGFP